MRIAESKLRATYVALFIFCLAAGVISIQMGWNFLLNLDTSEEVPPEGNESKTFEEIKGFHFKPEFEIQNTSGQTIKLEDILKNNQKKWVLVHFWATWCTPCREELLELQKFKETSSEFRVIQITVDLRWDEVYPYLKALNLQPEADDYLDAGGKQARRHKVTMFPETFLLNSEGEGLIRFIGPQKWTDPELLEFFHSH